ncbi:hypothetical protein Dtox_0975 [Desulfofarcimen acetoxidans DSM 771]|jgi:hypothetical protein|uniref:Uncharacterized protein n=1 Tax=Desulfofarcimen acetoxidans (strain ATCC 49208 / DSM 771 / KCTC 5769 / VKM B-1644 / 5575) TaxID=485916 RepID=C8W397_DESAS|nr:hypothetical protein [Desulfofarcimen acetoxidans]ACV61864.1 hypothetical protein Dtox_0975 [Desulfofarcimen acetoxidans DSM 771]
MVRIELPDGRLDVLPDEQAACFEETRVRFAPFSGFLLLYEDEDLQTVKKQLAEGTAVEKYRQGKLGEVDQEHFEILQRGDDKVLEEGQHKTV